MRRVFLDTNVLLDIALEREYRTEAEKIWNWLTTIPSTYSPQHFPMQTQHTSCVICPWKNGMLAFWHLHKVL